MKEHTVKNIKRQLKIFLALSILFQFTSNSQAKIDLYYRNMTKTDYKTMIKYYPLSNYSQFPKNMRKLVRKYEFFFDQSRGGPDENISEEIQNMQFGNTANWLLFLIEKHGWCWGDGWVEADMHWYYCDLHPGYNARHLKYIGPMFKRRDFIDEAKFVGSAP